MSNITHTHIDGRSTLHIGCGKYLIDVKATTEGVTIDIYCAQSGAHVGEYTAATCDEIIAGVVDGDPEPGVSAPNTEYYVGDPCYALSEVDQLHLTRMIEQFGHGYLTIRGKRVWVQSTYYGDGVYALRDALNHEVASLAVDSGKLAAIPVDLLRDDTAEYVVNYGFVADLGVEFDCSYDADTGTMRFGTYSVRTGE